MSSETSYKEQQAYCAEQVSITEDRQITVWGLGGFVPYDPVEAVDFLAHNPTYRATVKIPMLSGRPEILARFIELENQERHYLVARMNNFLTNLEVRRAAVGKAASAAGLPRSRFDKLRLRCSAFDELWYDIEQTLTDELEEAVLSRSIEGVKQAVYHQGEVCGTKTVYSDSLAAMALQGRRPEVYKPKSATEITGADGAPLMPDEKTVHVYLPDNGRSPGQGDGEPEAAPTEDS